MKRFNNKISAVLSLTLLLSTMGFRQPVQDSGKAGWVPVSDTVMKSLADESKKIGYPGGTAGVCVDRTTGAVYMIVPDQGIWKSSDRGLTFQRMDGGALGGRCETGFALNPDPAGKRLAAFMLDGQAVVMSEAGKTWKPIQQQGRGWDYGAADWSAVEPQTLLAVHHETGADLRLSRDGGKSWSVIGTDYSGLGVFDDHTFVATKGKGILRSTDSGATWTTVSDLTPSGRVVCVLEGKGYWLSRDGLLVSNDKGKTWSHLGSAIEATWGPFFGKSTKQIAVVGRVNQIPGIYRSDDSGATWKFAAPFPTFDKESIPDWTPGKQWAAGWFCCFGWDPIGNIFYASRMGHPTMKFVAQ